MARSMDSMESMEKMLTPEQLQELQSIDSATLANAIEGFKVRDVVEGYVGTDIRCQFPDLGVMVGYAVTAVVDGTSPGRPPPPGEGHMQLFEALQAAPKPAVVVLEDRSPRTSHSCLFGDVFASIAHRLGAVGVVTNGGVRDLEGIRPLGFHVFAGGLVVAHGSYTVLEVNVPLTLSGVAIQPGELLHGDANGVITVPSEIADRVYEQSLKVHEAETSVRDFARSPEFSLEKLRAKLLGD